jgi:polysaccharide biosynthesis/export protein VpsN
VIRRGLSALLLLVAVGCRPAPEPVDLAPPVEMDSLGPGDVFTLHIIGEDKLPTEYTVAPDGSIDVPFIHRVKVEGLETQQVSDLVRKRLMEEQIFVDPTVVVGIKAMNSKRVVVGGEVKEDGSFAFVPGMTLTDAIAKAGGMTPLARSWRVILVRQTKNGSKRVVVDYDAINDNEIPDVPLQAGDKITVPQRAF